MNEMTRFIFNNRFYYIGTIVKIKEQYQQYCKFNSVLKFTGYIVDERTYCFSSLQNNWEVYKLSDKQISEYVESVLQTGLTEYDDNKMKQKYIDGIVSAWIWYILIMLFALCVRGIGNVIVIWCVSTFIFFTWRHKKIKGG